MELLLGLTGGKRGLLALLLILGALLHLLLALAGGAEAWGHHGAVGGAVGVPERRYRDLAAGRMASIRSSFGAAAAASARRGLATNVRYISKETFLPNFDGIAVRGGHETYIRNTFLGQHMTAGTDPGERSFTGTGIRLDGNDNSVSDVVVFSAGTGIMVTGGANTISGVHCYNKASGFGGTGIYLKVPGLTQTWLTNCYMDYTSIVAEDPVLLHVSGSFFLGDANVVLKAVNGVARGVQITGNLFNGRGKGVDIVQLDGAFKTVEQVYVQQNSAMGMNVKATAARGSVDGNGTSWTVDFASVLLFPDRIGHVQYSLVSGDEFPGHTLRNVSGNQVVVATDKAVAATVHVLVDQNSN